MAVNPGSYSFVLQRGADWSVLLQFKDSNNDAVDLSGATVAAQAWNQPGTKKYADFGIAYTNRSNGQTTISLDKRSDTTTFPDKAYYDVLVTTAGGLKNIT